MMFSDDSPLVATTTSGLASVTFLKIPATSAVERVAVAFSDALPTGAKVVVGVLKKGGAPATLTDYHDLAVLTAPSTVFVAGGTIAVYLRSGGTAGTVNTTVTAS